MMTKDSVISMPQSFSQTAGMIIESFDVECFLGDRKVYVMDTVFGFFPKIALQNQVGHHIGICPMPVIGPLVGDGLP